MSDYSNRLRMTAFPPGDGPYERWELTVEETGRLIAQGAMPMDEDAVRVACDAYWEAVRVHSNRIRRAARRLGNKETVQ